MKNSLKMVGLATCAMLALACSQSDAGITTAVKSRFASDDTVKAYQIDVDTNGGVVTLTGAVETPDAKEQAISLAHDTEGVVDVVDHLTVNPSAGLADDVEGTMSSVADAASDAAVTAAVKSKMLADTSVGGLQVNVDTRDGVVTLTGTVASAAERDRALALARDTDGVLKVQDQLVVRQ
jgi:osmotically-inducible protein OsmY